MKKEAKFDPRKRTWYQQALATDQIIRTEPYLFFTDSKVGITFAKKIGDEQVVVGADIRLETLSQLLKVHKITPGTHLVVFDNQNEVVAYNGWNGEDDRNSGAAIDVELEKVDELGVPVLTELNKVWQEQQLPTRKISLDVDDRIWTAGVLHLKGRCGDPIYLGIAIPDDELMAEVRKVRNQATGTVLFIILCLIPLALFIAKRLAKPIGLLADEANSVSHFDFQENPKEESRIREVGELTDAVEFMKKTISKFLTLIECLNKEKNFDSLLELIGKEARSSAAADSVCIYTC